MFELTAEQINQNWEDFREKINCYFPNRKYELNRLYDDCCDKIVMLPASGTEHYHNAIPGGYVDHVLRVVDFAEKEYDYWKNDGLYVDNFTLEELRFSAFHHDLGKIGLPQYNSYIPNNSEWHRVNQGKLYTMAKNTPFALIQDLSLYLLQSYGVKMSWPEYLAIRTHDGIYDDSNKAYYINSAAEFKSRININQILHNADMKAARFEFERWAKYSGKFEFYTEYPNTDMQEEKTIKNKKQLSSDVKLSGSALKAFDKLFGSEK